MPPPAGKAGYATRKRFCSYLPGLRWRERRRGCLLRQSHLHKALGEFAYTPEEVKKETSWHGALADRVTLWIGKPQFLGIHLLWFLLWVMINTGVLIMAPHFDAPPFSLLGILLSMEAIFITGFLLISQNRQSRRDAKQAELDYEVNVRTFRKIAEMERTLQQVLDKLEAQEKTP